MAAQQRTVVRPYPLSWPQGWPRTDVKQREKSKFRVTMTSALEALRTEVRLIKAGALVVSSNCTIGAERPEDPGVCAFFEYQGVNAAIPCDRWKTPEENLRAIAKTIEAMRGIERWGAKHMLRAAFSGFAALPPPMDDQVNTWRQTLGFSPQANPSKQEIERAYRKLAAEHHPDNGGDAERFRNLVAAKQAGLAVAAS